MFQRMSIVGSGGNETDVETREFIEDGANKTFEFDFNVSKAILYFFDTTSICRFSIVDIINNKQGSILNGTPYSTSFMSIRGKTVEIRGGVSSSYIGKPHYLVAYK